MRYNAGRINELLSVVESYHGIANKSKLEDIIRIMFDMTLDRSVFYNKDFSIRFSQSKSENFSNTVLSLSALQKYDAKPFFVCLVMPNKNRLFLANTSCLFKISHSSQKLSENNIKGSFNGSDIMKSVGNIENKPVNFELLFMLHSEFTFEENLVRLVESTNGIVGRDLRYKRTAIKDYLILEAPIRAKKFLESDLYIDLNSDLSDRVNQVLNEIIIASLIDNVNLRGRIIEYLITHGESDGIRAQLISSLSSGSTVPSIKTDDQLGDYDKKYELYSTKTDIKTKVLYLNSAPKAYNIDKLLDFLSYKDSVYMIFFIGVAEGKTVKTHLCSLFNNTLLDTTIIQFHWAGRNSRGVSQFSGKVIDSIITKKTNDVDVEKSQKWLNKLLEL